MRDDAPHDPEAPPPAAGERRVLVVDDNELNRDMLARRLRQRGYRVDVAESGPDALEMIETSPFDVILLDVMMPGMSGLEVLKTLRASFSRTGLPVIMATARDASEDIVEALTLGANDYVTKPLDFAVVLARIETQISLKRAQDQIQSLNRNLLEAQERIAHLAATSEQALRDMPAWSRSNASEVARTVGARSIGVFAFEDDGITAVAADDVEPPTADELRRAARSRDLVARGSETLAPVLGLTGELVGGLVVSGKDGSFSTEERRLLQSFAHQLGGALELTRTRRELALARERTRESRQEMLDRGIDLLQLCPTCGSCYDQNARQCGNDGRRLTSPRLLPYRILDRYRLVRLLGEGGMGTVFQAEDVKLDRQVALKILKPEHFDDPSQRIRFQNEARAAARVEHPGVVAVFDSGQLVDGSLFLVMELLEGYDLANALQRSGRGTPLEVASLLRQGSAALAAAHRVSLIHRDVKPENIFLVDAPEGFHITMLDFGVAKQLNVETHLTRTGLIVGTPAYMSPEQLLGREVDARSDLYSFAAVCYEALTGRRVTLEEDLAQIFVDVLQRQPPAVSVLRPGIPPAIDEAFARALAKEPSRRPADIEGWAASLARLLDGVPADEPGWTKRPSAPPEPGETAKSFETLIQPGSGPA